MIVESVAIETLSQDINNVRHHDKRNVDTIKASLERFGQQKPIVVDGHGTVVAGNGTLGAATLLGWSEINVVRTELTGAEAVAFAVADNRTAELAEWDAESLASVLDPLDEPLREAAGFNEEEVQELLSRVFPKDGEYLVELKDGVENVDLSNEHGTVCPRCGLEFGFEKASK